MTAPRLIRLVPTGETFQGVDLVEPCEVQPLSEELARELCDKTLSYQPESYEVSGVLQLIRAVEQAHGIGRRMDA